jgi:hypothetical protein
MHGLTDRCAVVITGPNTWEGDSGYFESVLTFTQLCGELHTPIYELVVVASSFGKDPYQLVPPNAM